MSKVNESIHKGNVNQDDEVRDSSSCPNEGKIVDAEAAGSKGASAFRHVVEITNGGFEFQKSQSEFPVAIQAVSNTNLILDTLQQLDEAKA